MELVKNKFKFTAQLAARVAVSPSKASAQNTNFDDKHVDTMQNKFHRSWNSHEDRCEILQNSKQHLHQSHKTARGQGFAAMETSKTKLLETEEGLGEIQSLAVGLQLSLLIEEINELPLQCVACPTRCGASAFHSTQLVST